MLSGVEVDVGVGAEECVGVGVSAGVGADVVRGREGGGVCVATSTPGVVCVVKDLVAGEKGVHVWDGLVVGCGQKGKSGG